MFANEEEQRRSLLPVHFVETRKFGTGPDFSIFTSAMKALSPEEQKELSLADPAQSLPLVRMRGSSTVFDLQKDCMMLSALHDMQQVDENLTLWLNHSYSVPDDVYGTLFEAPLIQMQQNIADLWLTAHTCMTNEAAAKTYTMIVKDKLRMGCSVGCEVLEWSFADPDDEWNSPILIHHVKVLEWSIVGIPANQRCWVEAGIRGLFARALVEGRAEDVLRLAPAFKGLYTRDYQAVCENVTNAALRKDLNRTPMRSTAPHKLIYDFTTDTFGLEQRGKIKSLTREQTDDLLRTMQHPGSPAPASLPEEGKEVPHPATSAPEAEEGEVEPQVEPQTEKDWELMQKGVCGKTSWPLADLKTEWTGSRAEKEIFGWATDDQGELQAGKVKQGFLYFNPDQTDKRGGYKMPFCYKGASGLTIVPLGVRECANVLNGGMGGVQASDADKAAMRGKCKMMYGRINREFQPDPAWVVPWEQKESAAAEGVLSTENGDPLVRQDLREEENEEGQQKMVKGPSPTTKAGPAVSEDGGHESWTGTHTHAHKSYGSQGDDAMHEHAHTHDGDAHHGHAHAEKQIIPATVAQAGSTETTRSPEGTPLAGGDESLLLTQHATPSDGTPSEEETTYHDALVRARLHLLNDCARALGVPELSWDGLKAFLADQHEPGEGQSASLGSTSFWLTRAGRSISAANGKLIKQIHDAAVEMHPACCGNAANGDGDADGDGDNDADGEKDLHPAVLKTWLQQALTPLQTDVAQIMQAMQTHFLQTMQTMQAQTQDLQAQQQGLEERFKQTRSTQQQLTDQLQRLSHAPLGRPTGLNRSLSGPSVATYEDMRAAGQASGSGPDQPILGTSLADLEAYTSLTEKAVPLNGAMSLMKYRVWPANVGGPVGSSPIGRPALTQAQKRSMLFSEWEAYEAGQAASVPLIDDPFGGI